MVNDKPQTSRSTRSNPVTSEMGNLYEIIHEMKNKLECCYEIIKMQNGKIDEILNEMDNLKHNSQISNQSNENVAKKSFADATKQQSHVLIVKPKDKRNNDSVKDDLKQNINPTDLQIGLLQKNVKSGAVLVKCSNFEAVSSVKNDIQIKMGDRYEVQESRKFTPRIIITGITEDGQNIEPKNLLNNIVQQNKLLRHENFRFDYVFCTKIRNGKFNMVVEADPITFKLLMEKDIPELYIGWNICKFYEHFSIKRCYNCWGFNHEAKICKEKAACVTCAGNHQSDKCKSESKNCINCIRANNQLNLNLDTNHAATDRSCKCFQRIVNAVQKRVDYVNLPQK